MHTRARASYPGGKSLAWTLAEGRMIHCVVNLVRVIVQMPGKLFQRPDGVSPGIHTLGDLPAGTGQLRVACQIVKEVLVGCAENPLARGAKSRLSGRSRFLDDLIPGEQRFEVCALKIRPTVNHDDLRKAHVPAHTFPQHHHARTIARGVKCEPQGQDAPRERVAQEGHPWTSQDTSCLGANNPYVGLCMVDVSDLEGAISMSRGPTLQLPEKRFLMISSPRALPLHCLLEACPLVNRDAEGLIAWRQNLLTFTDQLKTGPGSILSLLLQGFVISVDELQHHGSGFFRQFIKAISRLRFGQQA